uniref:Peroxidase n=1 Tax=Wollemia nobilis TaxID=56998 RepID=A0A0C9S1F5_9CONI
MGKQTVSVLALSAILTVFLASASAFPLEDVNAFPTPVDGLSWTFYNETCPSLETIVKEAIDAVLATNITQAAGLLRLVFHDCFVQGCDASILVDDSSGERSAIPNQTLRPEALTIINNIKSAVEAKCSGVVSCADILVLTVRDSVSKAGGPWFPVPLGRRDSLSAANVSLANANLPGPTSNVTGLMAIFGEKGFNLTDLVALSGAHTIGIGHCASFIDRLYPTQADSIDQTLAKNLYLTCPTNTTVNTTNLDIRTPNAFDNKYYVNLQSSQGLFTSDQALYINTTTKSIVKSFALNQSLFFEKFVLAMLKMVQLEVLTGSEGEIRSNCSVASSSSASYFKPSIYSIVDEEVSSSSSL